MKTIMQLAIAQNSESLQEALLVYAKKGKRIALVPTMGALHAGHATLIRHAANLADVVAVSIFVNPTQFGPKEDFSRYPRMLEQDVKTAQAAGASVIYAPDVEDLYPQGFSTTITAGLLSTQLCGQFRPGHFDGVATVVTKLLLRSLPHVAVFGEKDYQQLCVIRRVVDDLDIPVEIVGAPTVREPDGLALSSRNAYLTKEEREIATTIYKTLSDTANKLISGKQAAQEILATAIASLNASGFKVDYLEMRDADTCAPMEHFTAPARLLVAAWLGKTRLIDNIAMGA